MTITFPLDCPHCHAKHVAFTVRSVYSAQPRDSTLERLTVFATCNNCIHGVTATELRPHGRFANPEAALIAGAPLETLRWQPRPQLPDVPEHLPEAVEAAYLEAEKLRLAGFRAAAGNAYRRALEAALREVDATLEGSLHKRIETLASRHDLTPDMRDFAHHIRSLGNAASHETPTIPDEEIDDLALFTKLFLIYQFTLPQMLAKRRAD